MEAQELKPIQSKTVCSVCVKPGTGTQIYRTPEPMFFFLKFLLKCIIDLQCCVSGVQQSYSDFFLQVLFHNRLLQDIEFSSLHDAIGPCHLSILYVVACYLLEKAMAPHSSTPAWKIPWTEEPGPWRSWIRLSDFTFTFHFHALEKEMATHSSVLAWRIPGMGEPGGLPSMGSHRVGHN